MARKRLRLFLDEVISDADLRTSVERVAGAPVPADPALAVVAEEPAADARATFPPPPWEKPPALNSAPAVEAAPIGGGDAATPVPAPVELPATTTLVVSPAPDGTASAASATPEPAPEAAPETLLVHAADDAAGAVLLGAAAEGARAGRRRRRSAALLPPLPSATDVPEDAPGRVAIFAVPGPAAVPAPIEDRPRSAPDTTPAPIVPVGGEAPLAGWLPVLALGVALVVVFVIGVLVTR